jgi:hypothetical protein
MLFSLGESAEAENKFSMTCHTGKSLKSVILILAQGRSGG